MRSALLAIGLTVFLPASLAATSIMEGRGGFIGLEPAPDLAGEEMYLRPGGPWAHYLLDLGVDARDVEVAGELLLVAAGEDGLLVLRLAADGPPQPMARLPIGEPVHTVAQAGGVAWLTGPSGLTGVAIGDPARPVIAGRYASGGAPLDFIARDARGYLLLGRELHVLDLARDNPARLARHAFGFEALAFEHGDDGLYIAAGEAGLVVLGFEGPAAGMLGYRGGAPVLDVALSRDRVYLAQGPQGITALGRGAGGALEWLGSLRVPGTVTALGVRDDRALALTAEGRLYLASVENPQAMELLALLWEDRCCEYHGHVADGALALAGGRLIGFELAAPPPRTSNEGLSFGQGVNFGGQRRVFIEDGIAYVADWFSGLHLYDLGTPERPVLLSSLHTGGSPKGVVVRDGIAYVADDDHGLLVLDVGDPRRPRELARLPLPGLAYTPVLDGDRLYIAVHHGGIVVVDVRDPRAPGLVLHHETPGKAWSLRVRDGLAYVADDDAGLLILDVGTAREAAPIGRFDPGGQVEEVLLDGQLAYLALYDDGVHVVDISDPAAPVALAHVPTPGNARGLALRDGLLFVADWLAGVHVLDVADPGRARILGTFDTDGAAWGLALHGDIAFVADWWGGISVLDAGTPARPELLGTYPRREVIRNVAAADRFGYIAQGDAGLQIFDIGNPLNPTWVTGIDVDGAIDVLLQGELAWVLLEAGRLVAADISNPYQARIVREHTLGHAAHALRPAGTRALAIGAREYSVIGDGAPRRHVLGEPVADAWSVDGRALVATADGRLRTLREDGAPGEVLDLAGGAGTTLLRGDGKRVVMHVGGEGLRVLEWEPAPDRGPDRFRAGAPRLSEVSRIPLAGGVDAMALDGDRIHVASGRDLRIIGLSPLGWAVVGTYRMMEEIGSITVHDGVVYVGGAAALRALEPLPQVLVEADGRGAATMEIPPGLPPGSYDLGAAWPPDAVANPEPMLRDVFRVEPLRLGRTRPASPGLAQ